MRVLEDGGYRLAIELEASSAWRPWLGDQLYSDLRLHLVSAAAWAAFMKSSEASSANPSYLRLQLKVRALLFDRALEFPESPIPSSQLNPTYLQLQPDNVYFTLENDASDWTRLQTEGSPSMAVLQAKYGLDNRDTLSHHFAAGDPNRQQKSQQRKFGVAASTPKQGRNSPSFRSMDQSRVFGRVSSGGNLRGGETDDKNTICDFWWYDQWFNKNLTERMHRLAKRLAQQKLPFAEQEALKRTPEGMAAFVSSSSRAQKRHQLIIGDRTLAKVEREQDPPTFFDSDLGILPEMTSVSSVPENPCPGRTNDFGGPYLQIRKSASAADGEASLLSGVSSQLMSMKQSSLRKTKLTADEAELISQKTIAKILESHGCEAVKQISMEILSEVMVSHIRKLGSWMRMLLDSYRKHLSTDEVLRMFIQKVVSHPSRIDHPDGGGSLRDLADYVKNERSRASQPSHLDSAMMQQYQQLQAQPQSRQFAALQQSMYLENVLKKKQLPSLRANKMREDLTAAAAMDMKPYVATLGQQQQPWISQQMPPSSHSHVLQQLKQQLQLPSIQQQPSAKPGPRISDGFHEMLGADVMKQETTDDMEGTLGSPNKRKRKDY